ncbi:small RNA 2'-O-methyltransferase isoform X2 [Heterodontus francisci]|uniref:small RNA 2'-O-methyltransferase isoform X2 n=1 Tax=Heterodontus francisci TaxID=7792 RepID=UPI00355B208E
MLVPGTGNIPRFPHAARGANHGFKLSCHDISFKFKTLEDYNFKKQLSLAKTMTYNSIHFEKYPPGHAHQSAMLFGNSRLPSLRGQVADLGCAECTLLSRLKFCSCIEVLVGVDTNLELLKEKMYRLSPLPCEYLQPRASMLTVSLYHGSAAVKDSRMLDCDFVSCIELIEHLDPPELERFPEVVFGYINPAVVVITTPNADFNPLLPGIMRFRHWDHRFEWSRAEFQAWTLNIGSKYGYRVEFTGVGKGPPGTEQFGFCTQISIFLRQLSRTTQIETKNSETLYKLVYEVVYPSLKDKKILQDVVLNEVIYAAECVRRHLIDSHPDDDEAENWSQNERTSVQAEDVPENASSKPKSSETVKVCRIGGKLHIPLINLFSVPKVQQLSGSLQQLQEILRATDRVVLSACGSSVLYPAYDDSSYN